MRGERVVVRAFRNKPLVRRVWDYDKNAIYITDDAQYQLLINGKEAIEPIGFPKEDVFVYDPELIQSDDNINWEKLTLWASTSNNL